MVSESEIEEKSDLVVGGDKRVPTLGGTEKRYVNLDNSATTPSLKGVKEKISSFLEYYSSVGRGTGFKSRVSTKAVQDARRILSDFVGADPGSHTLIFTKHATEAINKVANRVSFSEGDVVISTWMEHHANMLPWRKLQKEEGIKFVKAEIDSKQGKLDVKDLLDKIDEHKEDLKMVAISGASNVTGYLPPIEKISRAAHHAGGYLLVDAAQLAPHRKIEVGKPSDPDRIDFLAFSGHKMYAPFGAGALVGPRHFFEEGEPEQQGGGAVDFVGKEFTLWSDPPAKEETGTPNTVGVVAMAKAAEELMEAGMEKVSRYEDELTEYGIEKLSDVSDLHLYGPEDTSGDGKLGIFTFNLEDLHHNLVSAILSYEYAIATRSGCFCAHPYIIELLDIPEEKINMRKREVLQGVKANLAGAVRASLGIYNTKDEIDQLTDALEEIASNKEEYKEKYYKDEKTGEYLPEEGLPDYRKYFSIEG